MSDKDHASAFPLVGPERGTYSPGMDLRDYFAAKAMQGILSDSSSQIRHPERLSEQSYQYADAMMEARKK